MNFKYTHRRDRSKQTQHKTLFYVYLNLKCFIFLINWHSYVSGLLYDCLLMLHTKEAMEMSKFQRGCIVDQYEGGLGEYKISENLQI